MELNAFTYHASIASISANERSIDRCLCDRFTLAIFRRRSDSDSDFTFVRFIRICQKLDDFRGFPDADRQTPSTSGSKVPVCPTFCFQYFSQFEYAVVTCHTAFFHKGNIHPYICNPLFLQLTYYSIIYSTENIKIREICLQIIRITALLFPLKSAILRK